MKFVIFTLLVVVAMTMAAPEGEKGEEEKMCSPWLAYCAITDQCCRHLVCSSYQAKCVPKGGLIIPGMDTRPLGPPGSYPPGMPVD